MELSVGCIIPVWSLWVSRPELGCSFAEGHQSLSVSRVWVQYLYCQNRDRGTLGESAVGRWSQQHVPKETRTGVGGI